MVLTVVSKYSGISVTGRSDSHILRICSMSSRLHSRRKCGLRNPCRSASRQQTFSGYIVISCSCLTTTAPSFLGVRVERTRLNAFSGHTYLCRGDRVCVPRNTDMGLYESESPPLLNSILCTTLVASNLAFFPTSVVAHIKAGETCKSKEKS